MPRLAEPYAMVVGESLVDIVTNRDRVAAHVGGSAANTAVALARLGRSTELVSSFADDQLGSLIKNHLDRAGVRLASDPLAIDRTSTARATIRRDGSAAYEFDIEWQLKLPRRPSPTVVHVSSLATVVMPGAAKVLGLVRQLRSTATISYDINARPAVTGSMRSIVDLVECTIGMSDVVKASDEDLRSLYPGASLVSAARRILALGPRAVVVTRGPEGAMWFSRNRAMDVPASPVSVVDTIGAGDTFSAALIDRLWSIGQLGSARLTRIETLGDADIADILGYATIAAAISVSRPGADPPARAELDRRVVQ